MYCDAPDSPRRRATQVAMHRIFDALCRLLAPVLVFTAEEAWGYRSALVAGVAEAGPRSATAATNSVHLQFFPETDDGMRRFIRRASKSINCYDSVASSARRWKKHDRRN